MKKRQKEKIIKRAGNKLHTQQTLTTIEKCVVDKTTDSKICSALCRFRNPEFDAGTIYADGYMDHLMNVIKETSTIATITGVRKP